MAEQNHHNGLNGDAGGLKLWNWPTYLSIAIAMGILTSAAAMVDMQKIWRQIAACDKRFVLLGGLAHLPVAAGNGKFALLVFFYNFVDNLVLASAASWILFAARLPQAVIWSLIGAGVVEITLYSCLRVVGVASPLAGSLTVINRLVDYWLHIGLGVLVWTLRHVLGLRTWRDIALQDSDGGDSTSISADGDIIHDR